MRVLIIVAALACNCATAARQQVDPAPPPPGEGAERGFEQEIVEIGLADGTVTQGRLTWPLPSADGGGSDAGVDGAEAAAGSEVSTDVRTLIIYVQGTGPGTYLLKRNFGHAIMSYFDPFARELADRGIAFFSYNKRGVTNSEVAPRYDRVDRDEFRKVVPGVEADDIAQIVESLKRRDALRDARVVLLGWSEGTVVASLAAERRPDLIDAIMLAGYTHESMYDVISYQFQGHGSMLKLNPIFDTDGDGAISREEYESEDESTARQRRAVMNDAPFGVLDVSGDGLLAAEDFAQLNKPMHAMLLHSVEADNEDWIWNNYFRISVPWLREHFSLEANKTRLLRMDMPIYVFHGTEDAHLPASGVEDLIERFKAVGKTNLEAHIFADHDHDLNYVAWIRSGEMQEGMRKIFESAEAFDKGG